MSFGKAVVGAKGAAAVIADERKGLLLPAEFTLHLSKTPVESELDHLPIHYKLAPTFKNLARTEGKEKVSVRNFRHAKNLSASCYLSFAIIIHRKDAIPPQSAPSSANCIPANGPTRVKSATAPAPARALQTATAPILNRKLL